LCFVSVISRGSASVCTFYLDVYPGCKVVDTGTGSGCMTISLARAVAPHGHVYTYEYNNQRAIHAQEEFKRLKIDDLITVQCKDVCGKFGSDDGGFPGLGPKSIDAVFLDLPEPWLAIKHAKYV
jgi:tRNA (adenine57-N1/adenine58-N1)-methyltransferase